MRSTRSQALMITGVFVVASALWGAGQQRPVNIDAKMDAERAKKLYVSNEPEDLSLGHNFQRDIDAKKLIDDRFAEASKGVMDFQKITYRSSVGDLDIPAYLFQPL